MPHHATSGHDASLCTEAEARLRFSAAASASREPAGVRECGRHSAGMLRLLQSRCPRGIRSLHLSARSALMSEACLDALRWVQPVVAQSGANVQEMAVSYGAFFCTAGPLHCCSCLS